MENNSNLSMANAVDHSALPFSLKKKVNPNKARGDYSRQAKNKTPSYVVPESHKKRHVFIKEVVQLSFKRDVTKSDSAMYTRATQERKKAFYSDRAKAIRALYSVFGEHVNLVTHQIEISLRNASDAAGLTTVSDAELKKQQENKNYTPVVSISRASRAFKDMILLGWILAPNAWQVWDESKGYWIDKYYEATSAFFGAVGITPERVEKQKLNRLKYLKKEARDRGMTEAMVGRMSISQIKAERKIAWRRNAFERRAKEQDRKMNKRKLSDKTKNEQREVAIKNVLNALGGDIHSVSQEQFVDLVNKEIASLRKYTNIPPPLH